MTIKYVVGPFKTCYVDKDHPLMKGRVETRGKFDPSTELLVIGGNCYTYLFYVGGEWRHCENAEEKLLSVTVEGVRRVNFPSGYGNVFPKKVSPLAILNALHALQKPHETTWRKPMLVFVFSFVEGAGFGKVMELMVDSFDKVVVSDEGYCFLINWLLGKISVAMRGIFTPKRRYPPKWDLSPGTVVQLNLATVPEAKEEDEEVVRTVNFK